MKKIYKEKGFTLIELLATIVILLLVFTIGFTVISNLLSSSNDTIDDVTKKMIIKAAEEYALEFRNNDNWKEEVDDDGNISFCISLDSLINYGYFGNDASQFQEYKDDYFIEITIKNGVYTQQLIEKGNITKNCQYYKKTTNVVSNNNDNVDLTENGSQIGNFSYELAKINDKTYEIDINLGIDFKIEEIITNIPTYVALVVDNSGSMNGTQYEEAMAAAIAFSESIINNIPNANIALILYNTKPYLQTDGFVNRVLTESDFASTTGTTNTSGGLDMATSLFYKLQTENGINVDESNLYTVLLYDGVPNKYSYVNGLDPTNITSTSNQATYFKNFISSNGYSSCSGSCEEYVTASSNYLKKYGSKLIVIGYEMEEVSSDLKVIATLDNTFCSGSDYTSSSGSYCYYDSTSSKIKDLFSNISSTIIEEIKSTNAKSVKVVLTPIKLSNGTSAVQIYKDGKAVSGNKIVESLEDIDVNQETVSLSINETYQLILNDDLFASCTTSECSKNLKLFNMQVTVEYVDKASQTITIDNSPNVTITSTKVVTVN